MPLHGMGKNDLNQPRGKGRACRLRGKKEQGGKNQNVRESPIKRNENQIATLNTGGGGKQDKTGPFEARESKGGNSYCQEQVIRGGVLLLPEGAGAAYVEGNRELLKDKTGGSPNAAKKMERIVGWPWRFGVLILIQSFAKISKNGKTTSAGG